jgi:dTDP-4-dehydrorhamnose reductase
VNGTAAGLLAEATASVGAKLVQVSTDYVFDGDATEPYPEDATIAPVSAYGRTKAEGEQLALAANPEGAYVVRTAWLYGAHGGNFAKTMVKLAASHDTVKVVDDQLGQPTWTADLATQIVALLDSDAPAGVYHGTNSGSASWFEFAQAVFDEAGLDPARVLPTDSSAFVRPAPRPSYSVLGHDAWARAGLTPMRPWREALAEAANRGVLQTDDHAASSR